MVGGVDAIERQLAWRAKLWASQWQHECTRAGEKRGEPGKNPAAKHDTDAQLTNECFCGN